jgi:chromosome segregation ATPase
MDCGCNNSKLIVDIQAELQVKQQEYDELNQKLEQVTNSKSRLLKISQQQEEIIKLTSLVRKLEIDVDDLREANRKLNQSVHIRNDRLAACESQLADLQKSYEKGVLNLEPLVLEQVHYYSGLQLLGPSAIFLHVF